MKVGTRGKIVTFLIGTAAIFIFVLLWDVYALYLNSSYLPRPQRVFATLISILIQNEKDFSGFRISQHISASIIRVLSGFGLAAIIAIPIGLLSGWSWYIEKATSPIVEIIRPIPPLAWIPFAIYFFRDTLSSIFIVFIGAFFPILLSTVAGVKSIDTLLIDAARTLGAKRVDLFRKLIVPASIPSIMTGLRIGLGVGWMCVVAAELVGVEGGGLGVYIILMSNVGRFENVFAGMILIGVLGFIMVSSMTYVERRLFRWAEMS
jgi:NitT/TauT family transport system permease protein